jgi:hypothetical protein
MRKKNRPAMQGREGALPKTDLEATSRREGRGVLNRTVVV